MSWLGGTKKWISPFSMEDSGELVMMSDIMTYAASNPDISSMYAHSPNGYIYVPGGNRPNGGPPLPIEDTEADGDFSLLNDGSVRWVAVRDITVAFGAAAKNSWGQRGYWYDSPAYDAVNP